MGFASFGLFAAAFAAEASVTGIRIQDGHLALNGQKYVPNGLQIVAFVAPESRLRGESYVNARKHWGDAELAAAKSWGADLIRLQLGVCGLDPESAIYDLQYVADIEGAVRLARRRGFNVILSLQHQGPSGCDINEKMPVPAVQRAWQQLAPRFNDDLHIIYEMFNEPQLGYFRPKPAEWEIWRNGGSGYVGHQQVLEAIRATGSKNVVLADGLYWGKTFEGAPPSPLRDPAGQLAYAIHPYFNGPLNDEPAEWDQHFGNFNAAGHVMIATEWSATSKTTNAQPHYPASAAQLLRYLRERDIGNVAFAFDMLNTLVTDWSWNPTAYSNSFKSDPKGTEGPGALIKADFLAHPHRGERTVTGATSDPPKVR